MSRRRTVRCDGSAPLAAFLAAAFALTLPAAAGARRGGTEDPPVRPALHPIEGLTAYHLRILRARDGTAAAGSALFRPNEVIVPLSEDEMWGRSDQVEAVREALGASAVEALPGLILRTGPAPDGGPHRFRTALGETVVEIAFEAEELPAGWHRVHVAAADNASRDLLEASLRLRGGATTALAAPLPGDGETLVLGITPLPPHAAAPAMGSVLDINAGVTPPRRLEGANPIYPGSARDARVEGKVIMEVVVRRDGRPDRLVVLSMPEGGEWLAGAAVEAVGRWRGEPAMKDGRPVDVYMTLVVQFRIES